MDAMLCMAAAEVVGKSRSPFKVCAGTITSDLQCLSANAHAAIPLLVARIAKPGLTNFTQGSTTLIYGYNWDPKNWPSRRARRKCQAFDPTVKKICMTLPNMV